MLRHSRQTTPDTSIVLSENRLPTSGCKYKTAFDQLLSEVADIPLLTKEEEVILANRRKAAEAIKEMAQEKLTNPKVKDTTKIKLQTEIDKQTKIIEDVICEFMERNIKFAIRIAVDHSYLSGELSDKIASAYEGLRKAAEKFDPGKGGKFSTYAAWWIKQKIKRDCADTGRTIRLPVHVIGKLGVINKIFTQLSNELEREPTADEIAEVLAVDPKKIKLLMNQREAVISLDTPLLYGDSDAKTVANTISDTNAVIPGMEAVSNDELSILSKVLDTLNERERQIICDRFGLNKEREVLTLEEIGQKHGVTR